MYADDADHGKCNVIFVGIVPDGITPDDASVPAVAEEDRTQKKQLQDYSRKFKVRGASANGHDLCSGHDLKHGCGGRC